LRPETVVERDDAAHTPAVPHPVAGEAARPRRWRGSGGRRRNAHAVRAAELHRGVPESTLQSDGLAGRSGAALVVADQRRRLARGEGAAGAGRVAEAERSNEHRVVRAPAVREGDRRWPHPAGPTDVTREARQAARWLRRPAAHAQDAGITLGAGVAVVARRPDRPRRIHAAAGPIAGGGFVALVVLADDWVAAAHARAAVVVPRAGVAVEAGRAVGGRTPDARAGAAPRPLGAGIEVLAGGALRKRCRDAQLADGVVASRRAGSPRVAIEAGIAGVPDTVPIAILLGRVGDVGTVVARVPDAVAVAVGLIGIMNEGAVVAPRRTFHRIAATAVVVEIGRAAVARALVARVADAVPVAVVLVRVGDVEAVVARVADAVAVAVGLVGIVRKGTAVAARRAG